MRVTRFTNPGPCSENGGDDNAVVSESYTYTCFGVMSHRALHPDYPPQAMTHPVVGVGGSVARASGVHG